MADGTLTPAPGLYDARLMNMNPPVPAKWTPPKGPNLAATYMRPVARNRVHPFNMTLAGIANTVRPVTRQEYQQPAANPVRQPGR